MPTRGKVAFALAVVSAERLRDDGVFLWLRDVFRGGASGKSRTEKHGFTVAVLILCGTKIVYFLRRLCRILKKEVAYDTIL